MKKSTKTKAKPFNPENHLILRCCKSDGTSYNDFKWSLKVGAVVTAPDWNPEPVCGRGLHGWLNGQGDLSVCSWWDATDSKWLVLEAEAIVDLMGKVKTPLCVVRFVGTRQDACNWLAKYRSGVMFSQVAAGDYGTATAGYKGMATAGDYGTATAGDYGTATAGYNGTATAGDYGTATAGDYGTATAGYNGTATAGDFGTATAGDNGTATAGYKGMATAGDYGTATAGDNGTATAGDYGTATAGDNGTATAGYNGTIQIKHRDGNRYRLCTGYVGEDGIESNVPYKVQSGKLVKK